MKVSAVFLDRDGVINKKAEPQDYIKNWKEFFFLPDVEKAINSLNQVGIPIFVVTNQRGIARGLYTLDNLEDVHKNMIQELAKFDAQVKNIYFCPHNYDECDCRKPGIGLLKKAEEEYGLNLKNSVMVGDSKTDIEAGKNAGCVNILISDLEDYINWPIKPDYIAKDLYSAVELILNKIEHD